MHKICVAIRKNYPEYDEKCVPKTCRFNGENVQNGRQAVLNELWFYQVLLKQFFVPYKLIAPKFSPAVRWLPASGTWLRRNLHSHLL